MTRSAVREKSYGSMNSFWLDRDYINRQLGAVVDSLMTDLNVVQIVLFGSFVEDRAVPGSDVDILIILQSDSKRFIDRIVTFSDAFSDLGIAVDVFPYTMDELDNPVAEIAMRTGKVLFEG